MKQNINLKVFILAAAASLGFVASATAQSTNVAVPTPAETQTSSGLLGTRYAAIEGNYYDLREGPPSVARGFTLAYNQPFNPYVDVGADYSWARAEFGGVQALQQQLDLGTTAYTNLSWGKPFVLASAGWIWARSSGITEDSFAYKLGTGVEFQVLPALTVTPFVAFARTTGFNTSELDGGVKAAYRLTHNVAVTARVQYDAVRHSSDTVEYALGVNYGF